MATPDYSAPISFLCICLKCGWKVVTAEPDVQLAGHIKLKHPNSSVAGYTERHEAGHPTMKHEDAERIGQCWHNDALAEDAQR